MALFNQDSSLEGTAFDSDIELLQTDIQRFFALLAFCLLAIFSLVQAMPVISETPTPAIEDLSLKLQIQQEELEHLRLENQQVNNALQQALEKVDIARERQSELEDAGNQLSVMKEKITQLIIQKIDTEKDLIKSREMLQGRDNEIRQLKDQLKTLADKVIDRRSREDTSTYTKKPTTRSTGVGFSAKNDVFELLGSKQIALYINVDQKGSQFEVVAKDGRVFFNPIKSIPHITGMLSKNQVPEIITNSFRRYSTEASFPYTIYVSLNESLSSRVAGLDPSNNAVAIDGKGNVYVENK